jgi:hypothetical protein
LPSADTAIRVRDVAAGKDVATIELAGGAEGGPALLCVLKFSADEKVLAVGEWSGTVRLCDAATGKELRTLSAAKKGAGPDGTLLAAVEFSPDGRQLLTARRPSPIVPLPAPAPGAEAPEEPKGQLRLWDTATGAVVRTWSVPGDVVAAAFTPDGRAVATAAPDGVTLWEVASGKERFRGKRAGVVACSPDGRLVAAADGPTIRLLDARTGKECGGLTGHEADVQALAFTPDGKALVSGSADSTALVWDITRPAPKLEEQAPKRLEELWAELLDADASKASRAAAALEGSPKGAAALLAERLKPVPAPDAKQVAGWAADLNADNFDAREKAAAELGKLGELARPALEEALKKRPSAELRRRAEELLGRLKPDGPLSAEELRQLRAVEVLEGVGTPEAKKLLEELAKGAPGARLTREADAALRRLGK